MDTQIRSVSQTLGRLIIMLLMLRLRLVLLPLAHVAVGLVTYAQVHDRIFMSVEPNKLVEVLEAGRQQSPE